MRLFKIAPILLYVVRAAEDAGTSSIRELVGNLDLPDAEKEQMLNAMMLQDTVAQETSGVHKHNEASVSGAEKPGGQLSKNDRGKDGEVVPFDDSLQLTIEDGMPSEGIKKPKKDEADVTKPAALIQSSMDGTEGIVRTSLLTEQKFTLRLRKLLGQFTIGSRNKRESISALQAQLQVAAQQQKRMQEKALEDEVEIEIQRSRADAAEKRLQHAENTVSLYHKQNTGLRGRVRSLIYHLENVTHIGEKLQQKLADAQESANSNGQKLAAVQESVEQSNENKDVEEDSLEVKLREVQADKDAEESRLKFLQPRSEVLQQRLQSMVKSDEILHKENSILRGQLHAETARAQKAATELAQVQTSLADTQKSNMQLYTQLQHKYAESLTSLIVSQAGGDSQDRGSAPLFGMASLMSAPLALAASGHPSLLELRHDSRGLTALMQESRTTTHIVVKPPQNPTLQEIHKLWTQSQTPGLNESPQGMS